MVPSGDDRPAVRAGRASHSGHLSPPVARVLFPHNCWSPRYFRKPYRALGNSFSKVVDKAVNRRGQFVQYCQAFVQA
jgi:hypothetical protein